MKLVKNEPNGDSRRPTKVTAEPLVSVDGRPPSWDRASADIGDVVRPLLESLAKLASLETTYLVVFDWDRREQEVRFVFSDGAAPIDEGYRLPMPVEISQEAFPGVTRSHQAIGHADPDGLVARVLGFQTFVSVPVTLPQHRLFGMLCGASMRPHSVSESVVGTFESFARIVADHLVGVQIQSLEDRAEAAESQLLSRARFIAEAEHRMKTPLAILQGTSLTLRDRRHQLLDPARAELEESLVRNVVLLSVEVESLLLEARADIRTHELRPVDADLGPIVRELARAFDGLGLAHHVIAYVLGDVTAHVDPEAVAQILGHLIDNAIKFSPDGGSIAVRATPVDGDVEIEVIDEGVGLPPSVDVFAPFRRGEQGAQTPGIGLGLYIVRNLVKAMNGTVTARSNHGPGSTFTVTLPVGAAT